MNTEELIDEVRTRRAHVAKVHEAIAALTAAEALRQEGSGVGVQIRPMRFSVDLTPLEALREWVELLESDTPEMPKHDPARTEVHHAGTLPPGWKVLRALSPEEARAIIAQQDDQPLVGDQPVDGLIANGPALMVLGGVLRGGRPAFWSRLPDGSSVLKPYPSAKAVYQTPQNEYVLVQHEEVTP